MLLSLQKGQYRSSHWDGIIQDPRSQGPRNLDLENLDPRNLDPRNLDPGNLDPENRIVLVTNIYCQTDVE